jgi:CHASE3 domain sensor protein
MNDTEIARLIEKVKREAIEEERERMKEARKENLIAFIEGVALVAIGFLILCWVVA